MIRRTKTSNRASGTFVTRLYELHADELLGFFARRTCDPQSALDLVAETFATAIERQHTCKAVSGKSRRAWLYGIARNLLGDFYRNGSIERRAMQRLTIEPIELSDVSYERVEELADLHRERALMARAMDDLSEPQREALELRVIKQLSYGEVALSLGLTEEAARARVSRALGNLRDLIDRNEVNELSGSEVTGNA